MDCQVKPSSAVMTTARLLQNEAAFVCKASHSCRVGVACKYLPDWQVHDGIGWRDSALMVEEEERGVPSTCVFTLACMVHHYLHA